MPERTCSAKECDRPCSARGLCSKHYARWYKAQCSPCQVEGCAKPGTARGMCSMHYTRWRKYGDPLAYRAKQRGACSVDGCEQQHEAQGFCRRHYYQQPEQKAKAHEYHQAYKHKRWTPERLARDRERQARRRRAKGIRARPTPEERSARRRADKHGRAAKRLAKAAEGTRGTRVWTAGPCASCRNPFVGSASCFACSKLCRRRIDRKLRRDAYGNHRERARYHGVAYEAVKRADIFERDGYRCQLCGRKTGGKHRTSDGGVNPRAPTIDHIIPMACGGGHVYSNLQCACFKCNSAKGDRPANDQLLLALAG